MPVVYMGALERMESLSDSNAVNFDDDSVGASNRLELRGEMLG